jgi:hypothetical protein
MNRGKKTGSLALAILCVPALLQLAQGAYSRTGMAVTGKRLLTGSKTFSAELYVRNLENKAVLGGAQSDNAAPHRDFSQYGKNGYYMAWRPEPMAFNSPARFRNVFT